MPVADQDIFNTTGPAIVYEPVNQAWSINPGVLVYSADDSGVLSEINGSTLINNGNILGYGGVEFRCNDSAITNNGNIAGLWGIYLVGENATITNHGAVSAYDYSGIEFSGDTKNVLVENDGEVYGRYAGVGAFSVLDGGTINNSGLIHSDELGIWVWTVAGLTTKIDNAAGGTIKGADAAIYTQDVGQIALNNRGTIAGDVECDAADGNDTIFNSGIIAGDISLGSGNDTFNGTGGTAGEVWGEAGSDTLIGGKGKDHLIGGLDKDTLSGGKGADKFIFVNAIESVGANRDVITDFRHKQHDKIDLYSIDANEILGNDQAFKFIGKQQFHDQAGELRFAKQGRSVIVSGDTDGDGNADFQIQLNGVSNLVKGDFVL